MNVRATRFPLFDSLRAIAALTVFTIHDVYQVAVNRPEDHYWYRFGVHLDVAVPIFFGVSGFLLYRPFVAATPPKVTLVVCVSPVPVITT